MIDPWSPGAAAEAVGAELWVGDHAGLGGVSTAAGAERTRGRDMIPITRRNAPIAAKMIPMKVIGTNPSIWIVALTAGPAVVQNEYVAPAETESVRLPEAPDPDARGDPGPQLVPE